MVSCVVVKEVDMEMKRRLSTAAIVIVSMMSPSCGKTDGPHPPVLETGGAFASPTQDQKLWALATCGILTESNQERHDLLGGCERTPDEIRAWQNGLAKWWGVTNREDLLKSLKWIEGGGHRREFDQMARDLSAVTSARLTSIRAQFATNPSISNKIEVVLKYKDDFGRKGIAAWDFDRYVALCGWGYIAGYLTEEEAWQRIMPAARLLQKTFDSWKDLGMSHVVGREFWSWKHTQERGDLTRQHYERLLTTPSSPWVRLRWDTDLSPTTGSKTQSQSSDRAR
jgi:hypothetical protein